mmetsp:Transcript_79937/g.258934  ORF Transcript_79937/g.258934 Transcript_79937/m.258934 type:complete len:192 (-) Transcript_79937:61-636(-)
MLLACFGGAICICCYGGVSGKKKKKNKRKGPRIESDGSSGEEALVDGAGSDAEAVEQGSPCSPGAREARQRREAAEGGAFHEGELRQLLVEVEEEERRAIGNPALPPPTTSIGSASPERAARAEAAQEAERILATKDIRAIFGNGQVVERKAEYRRLVRLLHPDKGLASGERATLALRLVVESHSMLIAGA